MPLPDRPNLEYLKKLAKEKLQELRRADAKARLADAQLAVARQHGFTSWRALHARLVEPRPAVPPERITELFEAINRGEEAAVARLLADHPGLANARDPDGSTPLLAAAEWNHPGIVARLLDRGADPGGVYAHSAHTPLSWALTSGAFDSARALVQGGVEPDLFCAAGLGDVERIRAFFGPDGRLEPGASRTGSSRYAPDGTRLPCPPASVPEIVADALYLAARAGQAGAARELLEHDPDLSFRAFMGGTALHWAYFSGSAAVVALLIRHGADPTLHDPVLGCTPEAFGICVPASWGWLTKVRERLAEDPARVGATSKRGGPLHEGAWAGHPGVVRALLEAGADPGRRNPEGKTALDLARERPDRPGCVQVAEWLVGSAPETRRA